MAIVYLNGFDHFTDANQHFDENNSFTISSSAGRFGGGCAWENNYAHYATKILPNNLNEIYFGAALMIPLGTPTLHTSYPILAFFSDTPTVQMKFHFDSDRKLRAYNGSSVELGISDHVWDAGWTYLEIRVKVHATLGEVEIRVNEQVVLNVSGVNTDPASDGNIRRVRLIGLYYILDYTRWDDVYVDDSQFHGNVRVRTFMPTGDSGVHSSWDRSGGSNDYEMIDEKPADDATTYIHTAVKGNKSAFTITPGTIAGPIKAIQVVNRLYAATAALRRVRPFIRQGGVDYNLPLTGSIGASWKTHQRLSLADPSDSNPWTDTKLGTAEFGVELMANTTTTSTTTSTTTTVP